MTFFVDVCSGLKRDKTYSDFEHVLVDWFASGTRDILCKSVAKVP